jgi:hypothetical protein
MENQIITKLRLRLLGVPLSLKKVEKDIIEELKKEKLPVYFEIKNFNAEHDAVEYNIANLNPSEKVPTRATEIVLKYIDQWRKNR